MTPHGGQRDQHARADPACADLARAAGRAGPGLLSPRVRRGRIGNAPVGADTTPLPARDLARDLQAGRISLAQDRHTHLPVLGVRRGDLPKPPPALDEFVFMGWLHGTGEQDEASGGDSRLRRAAAALLEGRSTREWADRLPTGHSSLLTRSAGAVIIRSTRTPDGHRPSMRRTGAVMRGAWPVLSMNVRRNEKGRGRSAVDGREHEGPEAECRRAQGEGQGSA